MKANFCSAWFLRICTPFCSRGRDQVLSLTSWMPVFQAGLGLRSVLGATQVTSRSLTFTLTHPSPIRKTKLSYVMHCLSEGPRRDGGLLSHYDNTPINASTIGFPPSLSPWDHLSNKLLTFKSLSQSLFWGMQSNQRRFFPSSTGIISSIQQI